MKDSLIINRPWESLGRTAKYERMLQRREKIRQDLPRFRRQLWIIEELLKSVDRSNGAILEVACGMGFHLLELDSRGWNVTGLEIDPDLCRLINTASASFGLKARSIVGDACAIPVADGSFSVVLSHSFFEHIFDVDLALREQARILQSGGHLLIFDGNLLNPMTLLDLLIFYPLRTRGQHGGLKWMFTKGQVHENLYGYLPLGRDEDVKTPAWWRRRIRREEKFKLLWTRTGGYYTHPRMPGWMQCFLGSCIVAAERI